MLIKKLALAAGLTALIQLSAVAQTATTTPAKPAATTTTTTAPTTGAATTTAKPASEAKIVKSTTVVVSLNTSTEAELQQVKGIGKSHAAAIIKNRPFKSTDELVSKKIMSQKEFDAIKTQFKL